MCDSGNKRGLSYPHIWMLHGSFVVCGKICHALFDCAFRKTSNLSVLQGNFLRITRNSFVIA